MLTGSQIRRKFLDFFIQKGHREVHSSSLVPANDPTLLFTNAGMNQFKDVFLGLEKRDYNRATTSQKCVRAGGKHNDLENVGFTNRHHTFFEMLGNFSFGDYFKKDAIAYAWELITSPEWFGIPKEKLYATIFKGENGVERDSEAYDLWLGQGVPKERIYEFGTKDNFWQMGDTGPCGPCSEIHYDMGVAASDQGHADCTFGCDCGRYVELWNLVFMQFDRDASGKLTPLPKPSIDTGAGLERIASVLQGVISNYETDLFTPLIKRAAELTGTSLRRELEREAHARTAASLRIIADHARATAFLIADGIVPSNDGRGYVLRKIMRRAMRHALLLGQERPVVMTEMVIAVQKMMADVYPELTLSGQVIRVVSEEERRFHHTMEVGLKRLEEDFKPLLERKKRADQGLGILREQLGSIKSEFPPNAPVRGFSFEDAVPFLKKYSLRAQLIEEMLRRFQFDVPAELHRMAVREMSGPPLLVDNSWTTETMYGRWVTKDSMVADIVYPGEQAFKLYDTFGLPLDFMQDAARDQGLVFDRNGFDFAMARQRERARASWKGEAKKSADVLFWNEPNTVFEGYSGTKSSDSNVLLAVRDSQDVGVLEPGQKGEIVLDRTPFYAESGGQVGDVGWLYREGQSIADVLGCYFPVQGVRVHVVQAKERILMGDRVDAVINTDVRQATMRNHTATHLLHAGLREVLGKHVKQAGSLVAPNHLRFDFSHFTGVEDEELQDIEDIINKEVLSNDKVEIIENVPIDVAVNEYHAMALFGEKYGDKVRVIRIGDFSTELCGGTHTLATGEIGLIKILKEGSVSSGVRRIEAVTGEGSLRHFRKDHELEGVVASLTSKEAESPADALRSEIDRRDAEIKRLARELDQLRMKSASSGAANLADKVKEIRGVKVLAHRADNLERPQMRTLVDQLRDKLGSGVVVVGSASNGNVSLIAGVTKDLTGRIQAGKVVGAVAQKVGGKGGGRPDLAEAGGKDAGALDSALDEVYKIVESMLG